MGGTETVVVTKNELARIFFVFVMKSCGKDIIISKYLNLKAKFLDQQ